MHPSPAELPPGQIPDEQSGFGYIGGWRVAWRDAGQMIPYLEGVHAVRRGFPDQTAPWSAPLAALAADMATHLTGYGLHVIRRWRPGICTGSWG